MQKDFYTSEKSRGSKQPTWGDVVRDRRLSTTSVICSSWLKARCAFRTQFLCTSPFSSEACKYKCDLRSLAHWNHLDPPISKSILLHAWKIELPGCAVWQPSIYFKIKYVTTLKAGLPLKSIAPIKVWKEKVWPHTFQWQVNYVRYTPRPFFSSNELQIACHGKLSTKFPAKFRN